LSPTTFTGAAAASQQLTATVTDTAGNPITGLALTYSTSQPSVAAVSSTGLITTIAAGNSGVIASCTPPTCNPGANVPVYSNVVPTTVTGASATTVYVTGANSTSIVPIDTSTNTAGTAITIPQINSVQPVVNSFVFDRAGSTAYVGTNQGILPLNPSTNTFGTSINKPGVVLAVSPDGKKIVVADQTPATPQTYIIDATNSGVTTLAITTVSTAAAFSADSLKAYIVSKGNATLSVYSPALPFQTLTPPSFSAPANDVTFLSQGSLAYLAGGAGNSITARATCNNSALSNSVATAATPLLIASNFDSTRVYSVDGSNMYDVAVSNIALPANSSCPPTANNVLNTVAFGNTFTPNQMIVTSDGSRVFVTNNLNKLMVYNATNSTASSITLLNGGTATTTGGATLDSKQVYVGALGSNDVHRIDVTAGTDAQQIAVSLKDAASATVSPDFVVVRPK
jgi:DNA-binding beta-propeller fold protein YncE